jgi:hypothetical protein
MSESILSITFKDTVDLSNPVSFNHAIAEIIEQLNSAAKLIAKDNSAVYDYLRVEGPYAKSNVAPKITIIKPEAATNTVEINNNHVTDEDEMLSNLFSNLKRTQKSESILKYFVQNSGADLTIEQISEGASLSKSDLASWLAQTATKIPAITKPARGIYKFNPDKLLKL